MPVPGSDFDHNAAVLDAAMKQRTHSGIEENNYPAGEVGGVGSGQNVKEWAGDASEDMKSTRFQRCPRGPLASEKKQAEQNCDAEPGNSEFTVKSNAGNEPNRGEHHFACNRAARNFYGEAADQQNCRVQHEKANRQFDRNPLANVASGM